MASRCRPRGLQASCRSLGARDGGSPPCTGRGHCSALCGSGARQPLSRVGLIMLFCTGCVNRVRDPEVIVMLQAGLLHVSGDACFILLAWYVRREPCQAV